MLSTHSVLQKRFLELKKTEEELREGKSFPLGFVFDGPETLSLFYDSVAKELQGII